MKKIAYSALFLWLGMLHHGCYEGMEIEDQGVCEPRLVSIDDVLNSLALVAGDETTFNDFFEASYNELIKRSPEWATTLELGQQLGIDETLLDDISSGYREQTFDLLEGILQLIRQYDESLLSTEDQITLSAYEWYVADWFAEKEFMHHYYPLTQRSGPQFGIFGLFNRSHKINDIEDASNYVARLFDVRNKMACLRENLEISTERGYLPPKFMLEHNINVLASIASVEANQFSLYTNFSTKLQSIEMSDTNRNRLLEDALDGIETSVIPAYQSLVRLLNKLLPSAPAQAGVGLMPDGDAFYAQTLANHTTTDISAEEIHQLGLAETARIRSEMDTYFESLGYAKGQSLTDYYFEVADDGGYVHQDQVVSEYDTLIADALADLSKAIDVSIATDVLVICGDTAGYYVAGSPDAKEPGEFHTPCFDPHPWFPMPTLSYHEAVPGHHFQISLAQEAQLPAFRVSGATAYVEGWALYAERLAYELGWYDDDVYGDLGRLQDEMLRAVRLVVDTGLHTMGWTRAEATEYMVENTGFDAGFCAGQMDRYAAWPGQSTAYKIGMIKILELRQFAQDTLLGDYNSSDFHRNVLMAGSVPMMTLEQVVENYVDDPSKFAVSEPGAKSPFDESSPVRRALPRPQLFEVP